MKERISTKAPTEWFAAIPVRMMRSPTYRQLTPTGMRVVLAVIARQFGHGEWKFTAKELAREASGSVPSVRRAVRQLANLGLLVVSDDRHRSGGSVGWVLSVPEAALRERVAADQGGDHLGAPLPYREKNDQKDPPNPPCGARGARTERRGARTKVVEVDGVGAVDLARVPDPKLRLRDERKLEAVRAAQALEAAEAQAVAAAAGVRLAQQDRLLSEPMARCARLLADLRESIDSCGLEHDVPARAAAEDALREGEWVRDDGYRGLTEEEDLNARDALLGWCTRSASLLAPLAAAAAAHRMREALLAPYQTEAATLRDAAMTMANDATKAAIAARVMMAPPSSAVRRAQGAVEEAYRSVHASEDAAQAQAAVDTLRAACEELEAAVTRLHEVVAQAPPLKAGGVARPWGRRG